MLLEQEMLGLIKAIGTWQAWTCQCPWDRTCPSRCVRSQGDPCFYKKNYIRYNWRTIYVKFYVSDERFLEDLQGFHHHRSMAFEQFLAVAVEPFGDGLLGFLTVN